MYSFDSIVDNCIYSNSFVASLSDFSAEDQAALLRGEEVYDTLHNDGSDCALHPENDDFYD